MSGYRLKRVAERKNWYIVWSEDGKTKRETTRTADKEEADVRLEDFVERKDRENSRVPATCSAIVDAYLEDRRSVGVVSIKVLMARAKPIKKYWGKRLAIHIKRENCRKYTEKRRAKELSDATIRDELGLLRSAFRFAYKEGWVDREVWVERPPAPPPRDRFLTVEEALRLLQACRSYHLKLFVKIALNTGARSGAILDLTWDRVDLKNRRIDFNCKDLDRRAKPRAIVPINDELFRVLEQAQRLATTDFVIEYGGKQVGSIKHSFRWAADKAGLVGVTPHTLRRTAATIMANNGVSMWQVAGMLGHLDVQTTQKYYAKHSLDHLRDAANALNI